MSIEIPSDCQHTIKKDTVDSVTVLAVPVQERQSDHLSVRGLELRQWLLLLAEESIPAISTVAELSSPSIDLTRHQLIGSLN